VKLEPMRLAAVGALILATVSAAAGRGCPAAPGHPQHQYGNLCLPYDVVWHGKLTTDAGRASFVASTRFRNDEADGLFYVGPFRCHGRGCPLHRGRVDVQPDFEGETKGLTAGFHFSGGQIGCGSTLSRPGPLYHIDCDYVCIADFPGHVVATGTATLAPSRVPRPSTSQPARMPSTASSFSSRQARAARSSYAATSGILKLNCPQARERTRRPDALPG